MLIASSRRRNASFRENVSGKTTANEKNCAAASQTRTHVNKDDANEYSNTHAQSS